MEDTIRNLDYWFEELKGLAEDYSTMEWWIEQVYNYLPEEEWDEMVNVIGTPPDNICF